MGGYSLFKLKPGLNHDTVFLTCLKKNFRDVRSKINQMYKEVHKYIPDSHFENQVQENFHGAYWQLYITWVFHKYGPSKLIIPGSDGPDIVLEDGTIIEAVSVTPGKGENRPETLWEDMKNVGGGIVKDPNPKIVLRISNAIDEKKKKYRGWVKKGIVKADQPFIIAINAGMVSPDVLPHANEFSYGAKTVYAMGSLYLAMPRDQKNGWPDPDRVITRLQYSPTKIKHNGSEVESDWFLKSDHKEISGLIFSPSHYLIAFPYSHTGDIEYLSNGFAKNKLPLRFIRGIQYSWMEKENDPPGFRYHHMDCRIDVNPLKIN